MLKENPVLMNNAWYSLTGRWKVPVVGTLVYLVIMMVAGGVPYLGWIGSIVINGPMLLGYIFLIHSHLDREPDNKIENLFKGFNNFLNSFIAYLLMTIFILLWMLLLIIPGIVKSYSYAMTFFILADNPGLSGQDAITSSKQMMQGYRWKLFCIDLRFIGWWILCVLTLGILSLWITPYYTTTRMLFYRDLLEMNRQEQPIPDRAPEALANFYRAEPTEGGLPTEHPQADINPQNGKTTD